MYDKYKNSIAQKVLQETANRLFLEIAGELVNILERKKISPEELQSRVGPSTERLNEILAGARPSLLELCDIAEALGRKVSISFTEK